MGRAWKVFENPGYFLGGQVGIEKEDLEKEEILKDGGRGNIIWFIQSTIGEIFWDGKIE